MSSLPADTLIRALASSLPPIFTRREISVQTGKFLTVGTLANLAGKGGPPYLRSKRHAIYEKSSFLAWLTDYLEKASDNDKNCA